MAKWASNKKDHLIFENWRKFINEQEEGGEQPEAAAAPEKQDKVSPAAVALVKGHNKGLEDFVAMLQKIASDPTFRELARSGQADAGGGSDEALTVSGGRPVAAKELTPTQMDIDMEKSLGDQMKNRWTPASTEAALQKTVTMPSPGGAIPVLTYDNKYILDGHHRWSQVMMTNPDGKMTVNNLSGPALPNAEVALKATQLAIAALAGKVELKDTKINLLTYPKESMGQYVRDHITQEVLNLLIEYKKIAPPTEKVKDENGRNAQSVEAAAEYYMGNLAAIQAKPPGKFKRAEAMPQADESGVAQADVNAALASGEINFDNPELSDLTRMRKARKVAEE